MRLRHLAPFRQTRRTPAFSGNSNYRFSVNNLNPLNFESLFKDSEVAAKRVGEGVIRDGLVRCLRFFVPSVGEKFP
ncbi:hypothetical protein ABB26_01770 [Stenotrophomonas humi]|uniref:Uncharacterized protein n=1 Tax=Stenotrophomonas humi TaxID=405444 RepID=A0A0R0C5P4_9GAMM|nr:hypothetical protein [Stenotrophomonas humi]KRG61089.1 hypothetical protein ABB26_18510 [Stenotrophomonas humi]KRG61140.1 hypothetical protein ABB26_18470 [Stenotrophomonas humi]KRG65970.1 hypothetical protein ABB26_01770 [Stenotrophomonas humi]